MSRAARAALSLAVLIATLVAAASVEPPAPPAGAAELGLLLRRLQNLATVLVVTAHPDDENNGVLTALSRGQGVRTVLLTATRGEGGQNRIGPELGEALGILRSEELAAIHRRDGVEQYFARAWDFGYSFSVDETYAKWGRDEILADFVRVVRAVRPDVILTLPRDARGGGQHHQAAGRLAGIAFHAAADDTLFPPETVGGLEAWQARRLYEGATGMGGADLAGEGQAVIDTSAQDALLGTTWFDFGGRTRTLHLTQGMSAPKDARRAAVRYNLMDSVPPMEMPPGHGLLDRINTSWPRLLSFTREKERPAVQAAVPMIEAHLRDAQAAFDAQATHRVLEPLRAALAVVRRLREEALVGQWAPRARLEILSRLEPKEADLSEAIALAHGLRFSAHADEADLTAGQDVGVVGTMANDGSEAVKLEDVVLHTADGWTAERTDGEPRAVQPKASASMTYKMHVDPKAAITRSFGRKHATLDRYEIPEAERTGRVFAPPPIRARLFFTSGGVLVGIDRPVTGGSGDRPRLVNIVPALAPRFVDAAAVLPVGTRSRTIEVRVRRFSRGEAAAACRLEAPAAWTVTPEEVSLRFAGAEEVKARFELSPPEGREPREGRLRAVVVAGEGRFTESLQEIVYAHVEPRRRVYDAEMLVRTVDVQVPPDLAIGYVEGVGDRVAEGLEQMGARVDRLSEQDLGSDLSRYTTLVTGIRAYSRRPELRTLHARLLEYVKAGGHLVVQYNQPDFNQPTPPVPYPAEVTVNRITDETATMKVLLPAHPLLNTPNKIGRGDFAGWVQERGLYFLKASDPRYEELLAATDPFTENPGEKRGILVSAKIGAGRWTYVGLALWRQIEAGVPGAYRLLANLVSQPRSGA